MSKVIIVTGASSGIGKDSALRLIKEGHKVYGLARRIEKMQDIVAAGGNAIAVDITNTEQVNKAVLKVIEEQGKIDVLFNNAGYAVYGSVEDITIEEAKQQFDVNIFGLATITKAVLPYMRKAKSGKIINTSSMGGKMYTILGSWYHATKHALEGWSDCLRLELKPFNIDVVIIEPGAIRTEFGEVMNEPLKKRSKGSPYEEMANTVIRSTEAFYGDTKNSSPASVISDQVIKAINAKKPKTRYRAGKWAKAMIWMRLYLGDRLFDRILQSQMK